MAARRATKKQIDEFRLNYRLQVIEKLALKAVLFVGTLSSQSMSQSHSDLRDWLDKCSEQADEAYGEYFRDPATMALYADEVKSIVEEMKKDLDSLVKEIQENLRTLRGT